jgi:polysaccharide biosynthesis protein PslH
MRILLLTQVLPFPPDSGPKVKTWNVIKYLARHHEVTLVSFVRGDQSASVRHLQNYCREVHPVPIQRGMLRDLRYLLDSFLTRQPFLMIRDQRSEMQDLIDQLAARVKFDVVHADQLNMAQYAYRVPAAHKVIDAHNALWLLYKRLWQTMRAGPKKWLLNRDWQLLKKYEGQVCREFDAVLAVSEEDRQALEEAAGQELNITIIPIAIDTDEVTPVNRRAQGDRILHIGTMYWPPNIDGILWFLQEVLPLIRNERPEVDFDIVGANPPQEIIAFGDKDKKVHVTGYVEDPSPYLESASLMVVPLRAGGGMRVKILNTLGQGLPIVSTTLGCEGIAVQAGVHLLVADSPQDFAGAVIRLLEDRHLAGELGRRGRQLIESTYDYRVACRSLEEAYSKAKVSNVSV